MAERDKNGPASADPVREEGQDRARLDRPPDVPMQVFMTLEDRKRIRKMLIDDEESFQVFAHRAISEALLRRNLPELEPATANRPAGGRTRRQKK